MSDLGTCSQKHSVLWPTGAIWGLLEGLRPVLLILYYPQNLPQVLSYLFSEYMNKRTFKLLSQIKVIL